MITTDELGEQYESNKKCNVIFSVFFYPIDTQIIIIKKSESVLLTEVALVLEIMVKFSVFERINSILGAEPM